MCLFSVGRSKVGERSSEDEPTTVLRRSQTQGGLGSVQDREEIQRQRQQQAQRVRMSREGREKTKPDKQNKDVPR